MSQTRKQFLGAIVVLSLLAGVGGWTTGGKRLGTSRETLQQRIETYVSFLKTVRVERKERPALDASLEANFDRMLGSDIEKVDSTLRVRIAAMAMAFALEPSVQTTGTKILESPAKREFKRSVAQRAFREEPDFVEVRASVAMTGPFDSIISFVYALDAAPWLKRIESLRLDPETRTNSVKLSLRLSTIFVPQKGKFDEGLPASPRWPRERYALLGKQNPFALSIPEVAPPAVPSVPTPGLRIDPLAQWRLTGVVIGPDGEEAFLINTLQKATLEVRPGDAFDGITFAHAEGEIATFNTEGGSFRVLVGSTLSEPLP